MVLLEIEDPWILVRIVICGFMNTRRCIIFVLTSFSSSFFTLVCHPPLSPSSFTLLFHRYTEITKKDGGVVSKPNSVEYFDFDHQVRHVGETHGGAGEVEILNQS
jgi:hypothetical protein